MNKLSNSRTKGNKQEKRWAWRWGLWAEWMTVVYLKLKGWKILHHRYKTPQGEIDIVALKKETLLALEVKFRRTCPIDDPIVTPHQWKRIARAASPLLRYFPPSTTLRFDLILWQPWRLPDHRENAWWEQRWNS